NNQFLLCNLPNHLFHSISLISDRRVPIHRHGMSGSDTTIGFLTIEECSILLSYLLRFFMALPVGRELLNCLSAFEEIVSSTDGQSALLSILKHKQSSPVQDSESKPTHQSIASPSIGHAFDWNESSPLFFCWTTLLKSFNAADAPVVDIAHAVGTLASGVLSFCIDGESLSIERVAAVKLLFGLKDSSAEERFVKESLKTVEELINMLESEKSNIEKISNIMEAAKVFLLVLQNYSDNEVNEAISSQCVSLLAPPFPSRICSLADRSTEQMETMASNIFGDAFHWEFPENLRNRLPQTGLSTKRKASIEGPNRLVARGESAAVEASSNSTFSRVAAQPVSTSPGLTRRDAFRQRKPNTSRPPSMHVDDYVARERNADGTNSSNVIAIPRAGSSSGRAPSIHVDVFMARQKERQSSVGLTGSDTSGQAKSTVPDESLGAEKSGESQPLIPDLDDDLQGIDIVFDADEPDENDEKFDFPQPDDNLLLPGSVTVELQSPQSMIEDRE
ncbi:hypothetical protein M569_07112, partial [Genlisea aurea]